MSRRGESVGLQFQRIFENAPALFLLLDTDPDFTILGASDAYLRAAYTRRQTIVGRPLFEVFPDNPEEPGASGTANLRTSLERVIAGRCTDTMAVQKYDIRRPESSRGGFEERYWSPVNSPVLSDKGDILCIVHRVEDVTEFKVAESELREARRELAQAADCAAVKHALLQVDVAAAYSRHQRGPADRRRSRAGVEAKQNETGNVAAHCPARVLVTHHLLGPPCGPQEACRLGPRKPALAWRRPWREHDRDDLGAKALTPVVVDRRPQIFEFPPSRGRRYHARHPPSLKWLGDLPALRAAVVDIGPAVGAVYVG